jgi:predicted glycoside hydrolase/deacetylase ChbG (UPF0249 family)
VFDAQVAEFERLYGTSPLRLDGHQHMHLCSNVVVDKLIPSGTRVRRNFSFDAGEKNFVNRTYRRIVDSRLRQRHRLTDSFFALSQHLQTLRLARVIAAAKRGTAELMCHPEVDNEFNFLLSEDFANAVTGVELANFCVPNEMQYAGSLP